MGSTLLKLAQWISPPDSGIHQNQYSAIHLTPSSEVHPAQALIFEEEGFAPIRESAEESGIRINTIYKAIDDVQSEIIRTANKGEFDLLLLGSARSVFTEDLLGGKLKKVIADCRCNIGIFSGKNYRECRKIMVLLPVSGNAFIMKLIGNLSTREETRSLVIVNSRNTGLPPEIPDEMLQTFDTKLSLQPYSAIKNELGPGNDYDLLVIPIDEWKTLFTGKIQQTESMPSILILKTRN